MLEGALAYDFAMLTVVIEGWRFIPHSYALSTQYSALELLKQPDVRLYHTDLEFSLPTWKAVPGLFEPHDEEAVRNIPAPPADLVPDVLIRAGFPHDFGPTNAKRLYVFGTTETGVMPPQHLKHGGELSSIMKSTGAHIITTSQWARDGFVRSGAKADRTHVVHLGVAAAACAAPTPAQVAAARVRFEIAPDAFVFLNTGAMTPNKGIVFLFRAFAQVAAKHPRALLLLKGLDEMYQSRQYIDAALESLSPPENALVKARLKYIGEPLSGADMLALQHAADCYCCPYVAEGFNMPALEAAAQGLLVIATKGGSTDDFLAPSFSLKIPSTRKKLNDSLGFGLEPDVNQLVSLMCRAITDDKLRVAARAAGPQHVANGFTWKHTAARILKLIQS